VKIFFIILLFLVFSVPLYFFFFLPAYLSSHTGNNKFLFTEWEIVFLQDLRESGAVKEAGKFILASAEQVHPKAKIYVKFLTGSLTLQMGDRIIGCLNKGGEKEHFIWYVRFDNWTKWQVIETHYLNKCAKITVQEFDTKRKFIFHSYQPRGKLLNKTDLILGYVNERNEFVWKFDKFKVKS